MGSTKKHVLGFALASLGLTGAASGWASDGIGPYSDARRDRGTLDSGFAAFVGPAGPGVVDGNQLNPQIRGFATEVVDYSPTDPANLDPMFSYPTLALGPVTGDVLDVVSLGDLTADQIAAGVAPGSITLFFDGGIGDRRGPDFVVFENGFEFGGGIFGELAFVEVSTDGVTFARFVPFSLTPAPVGAIEVLDPTGVFNLAGKHLNNGGLSFGTPFDLALLGGNPAVEAGQVDLRYIRFVRIVDIPGNGEFVDGLGAPIFDPFPTAFDPDAEFPIRSGGFDLEAIAVLNPSRQ